MSFDFKGLKVVEIASVLAGPSVGMFFSELGADVTKIEHQLIGGDVTRSWKLLSESKESNVSAYFSSVNYNKTYRFLNLKDISDNFEVLELIKNSDILISNFKKGDDKKFGLSYEQLKEINPGLIYGAISGFGSENDRVAYDLILQAETGYMSMNGTQDSGPVKMPIALIDVLAAHQLKEGILIALLNKYRTGIGSKVNVSLYDTAICSLTNQASNWLMAKHIPERLGSLHPNIAPYGEVFQTKDNLPITFAIGSNSQFRSLMNFLNLEDFASHEKYSTNIARIKNRVDLKNLIQSKVQTVDANEILKYAVSNFIPAAEIKNLKAVFQTKESQSLVLSEIIDGVETKRVSTIAFKFK